MRRLFHFMDWPLRVKMAALLVVASLLPLGIATVINIRQAQQRMLANAAALLAARGDQLVGELDTFQRGYQRSVNRVAHFPDVVEFCQSRSEQSDQFKSRVRTVLEVWPASDANIRGVAILDVSGAVKLATEDPLMGLSLTYRSHVREALRGVAVTSDVYLAESQVGYAPTIAFLAPVFGPDRKVIGVAAFWVRAAALWDVMKASNELAGPGSYAVLFDRQGIRIAHTDSEEIVFHPGGRLDDATINALVAEQRFGERTRQLLEDVRTFPEQFNRVLADSPDRGMFRGFAPGNHKWSYGIARRFETLSWTVFYMIPEESLNRQIAQMIWEKATFAGIIILIALVAGMLFAAVILKPVGSLSNATKLIARDNLQVRVPPGNADELGQLGRSFNSMVGRIEAQATALAKARDELEIRVRNRTEELAQANQSLRKSEAQLQTIVENLNEGVVVSNLEGELLHFNRAALDMHGFADLAESRRRLPEFADTFELAGTNGAVWPIEQWPLARVLRGENLDDLEVRIRRIQSDWQRVFTYGGTLVHDAAGQALLAILTISDITERKAAEEEISQLNTDLEQRVVERTAQLQTANRELEAFSYSVSHDLRAPLRHIVGFVNLIQKAAETSFSEKNLRHLTTISQSAKRMGDLIDDLLSFSRVGKSEMHKSEVNLDELVRETVGDLPAETKERNIVWKIHSLPPVRADGALLRLVLANLISNAVKFTGARAEAKIEIGCAPNGTGETVIFIRDNGAGFDAQYTEKLFGVFQRLHSEIEFEGTGIGLANVQRIIHRHGGRAWAEGAVDEGATFYFSIPKQLEA